MPLYFCLSGLFYKPYGKIHDFIIKKTDKIFIPFIAWYLISYAFHYLKQFIFPSDISHFIGEIFYTHNTINSPLWFLLCLFWVNIYFTIIDRIFKSFIGKFFTVFILSCIGITLAKYNIFNFLFFSSALTCLPFYFYGYILKNSNILYGSFSFKKDFIILLISCGIVTLFLNIPSLNASMAYHENVIYGNPISIYILGGNYIIITLLLCKAIRKLPYFSLLGRFSIIVLVTHMLISGIMNPMLIKLLPAFSDLERSAVLLFIVLAILPIVINFCRKYLPYITAQSNPLQDLLTYIELRRRETV